MENMKYSREELGRIVGTGGIAYQYPDCLIEIADDAMTQKICSLIRTGTLSEKKREDMIEDGWEIASWSIESDTLILLNEEMILCIPSTVTEK
jgi:hypothetical protein